jgi:hypothetical protein
MRNCRFHEKVIISHSGLRVLYSQISRYKGGGATMYRQNGRGNLFFLTGRKNILTFAAITVIIKTGAV